MTISSTTRQAAKLLPALALVLATAMFATPAQAQNYKFKVLHTFRGSDGAGPAGQLVRDKSGNLYGVAGVGGANNCQSEGGCGTVFKMNATGKLIWQYNFNGPDGENPVSGLLFNGGDFYGTTVYGGKINNHICPGGLRCGVAFKLDQTGKKETVLHKFTGPPDGYFPEARLVQDAAGILYGTTSIGGEYGAGSVFKIDTAGNETVLYNFTGGSDGCFSDSGVVLDAAGNLYGATLQGGSGFCNSGYGVVYKVDGNGYETVLHTFEFSDGAYPVSVLLFDSHGNLYGTTDGGGSSGACDYQNGCGTVFELSPLEDGSWSETVLYNFCSLSGCADGMLPFRGPLVRDSAGNLYGTTGSGGTYCSGGCGVVFKLDTAGEETVLHDFTGGKDGSSPGGGLAMDSAGDLYGEAPQGGDLSCKAGNGHGCGTIFKITP